jgi:hypothetical protein
MNGLPRHEVQTASCAVEVVEPRMLRATRRSAGRRQASDGAGGDRDRHVHVANPWPCRGGRRRSRRGEEVSDLEQAPTDGAVRRVVAWQPPRLGAQLRCGLVTSRRPSGRRLDVSGGGPRMKRWKRDLSEQGPDTNECPDAAPSITGVTRPGHEPPHAGLVRSGATIRAPSATCQGDRSRDRHASRRSQFTARRTPARILSEHGDVVRTHLRRSSRLRGMREAFRNWGLQALAAVRLANALTVEQVRRPLMQGGRHARSNPGYGLPPRARVPGPRSILTPQFGRGGLHGLGRQALLCVPVMKTVR